MTHHTTVTHLVPLIIAVADIILGLAIEVAAIWACHIVLERSGWLTRLRVIILVLGWVKKGLGRGGVG